MKTEMKDKMLTVYLEGRIDSGNAPEVERDLLAAVEKAPESEVILDAAELDYISSAGLRVLMKLRKSTDRPLPIINVSRDVYDIFEVTGFTELFDIYRAYREISIEGLTQIGEGATAKVYRLDRENVVKVFNPNIGIAAIVMENERSRNAFVSGIPTAIAFDIVKAGDGYGTVYELLDAQDFLSVLENDKEHLEGHIRKFAATMREMHQIAVDTDRFQSMKQGSIAVLPALEGICTKDEIDKLRRLYETIPDRDTFIHGDCHPGNAMVRDGEFMFIDLMTSGSGHPIFDLVSMCASYYLEAQNEERRKASYLLRNFSQEEINTTWSCYLRAYFDAEDEAFLQKVEPQIAAVTAARLLFATIAAPGLFSPDRVETLKRIAIGYVDGGMEEIAF